jgi:hypothetical protein
MATVDAAAGGSVTQQAACGSDEAAGSIDGSAGSRR